MVLGDGDAEYAVKKIQTYRKIIVPAPSVRESLSSDFDGQTYVNNYEDLPNMGVDTKERALSTGSCLERKREGRTERF